LKKLGLFYEGKSKKLYKTEDKNLLITEFKDDFTALNAEKKGTEIGKGALNCKISTQLFHILEAQGIKTHLVKILNDTTQAVKKVTIIPIEVIVRNTAAGSLTKRLGIAEGKKLPFALIEFYYKNDALHSPILNDEHCLLMNLVKSESDLEELKRLAREINSVLKKFFETRNIDLIDFKIEFGIDYDGNILLADEISPDSCRLWDFTTHEKLDKDRFRQNIGSVTVTYEEILKRISSTV